ncbi:alcohol dehydrogenase catalytic domain-containing protein [Streptococcus anginosus]|uniref:alcohol dehydrogenase catalytic domain-containing protein n=1 Tax=Streptococcus anginosus TaxID=1328 RepID=UPI00321B994A
MMKAMVYRGGNLGNAFEVKEIKRPIPKEHQILVKVNYSSLNNVDYERFKGKKLSLFARATLLFGGKGKILGDEVSGQVEAVGEQVQNFKKGDEVFGQTLGFMAFGAWAEYALLEKSRLYLNQATSHMKKQLF